MINKRLAVYSFSASLLLSFTTFNQVAQAAPIVKGTQEHFEHRRDTSSVPTDSLAKKNARLKSLKTKRSSRFKDLEKEKERRKKIREKYLRDKVLNKN